MPYQIPKFLRREGDALLFNQEGQLIFYVPEIFFDREDAIVVGEYVNLLGIFDYAIFDKNGKHGPLHRFFFPTVFLCKPSDQRKEKNVKLKSNSDPSDYRLLIFEKDDPVVANVKVPENVSNVEDFFKIFLTGKLPTTTIDYGKMQDYFTESIALNGANYGINLQMFGFVIQAVCRSKEDISVPFRLSKFTDPTSYNLINIRDVPKYTSPALSICSENWDNGVVGAIMNPTDTESPMERLIMGNG